jgi:hypothetical protein
MITRRLFLTCYWLLSASFPLITSAQDYSAEQLLAGVKAARPSGGIYARIRMAHTPAGAAKPLILQVQIKRRITDSGSSDHLYQLLYPADRKGEGLLLRIQNGQFSGSRFLPSTGLSSLQPSDRSIGLFQTTLAIDDIIAEFLDWPTQTLTGSETLGNVPCHIIESRAPANSASSARLVRSWIDAKRFVTQKMQLFGSNPDQPLKTVLTEKVLRNKTGYYLPASFTVTDHSTGATTLVEGVRSDSGLTYTDADFTDTALQTLKTTP